MDKQTIANRLYGMALAKMTAGKRLELLRRAPGQEPIYVNTEQLDAYKSYAKFIRTHKHINRKMKRKWLYSNQ